MPRPRAGFDSLWDSSIGFFRVWITHLGRRYGILESMGTAAGPRTAAEIAARTRLHRPAVEKWLRSAATLGLVAKDARGYRLKRRTASCLVDRDHRDYLGGQFSYLALRSLDFDAFDGYFRRGARPRTQAHLVEAVREATEWDHTAFLALVVPRVPALQRSLACGADVIDVGCGSAEWDFRVARAFPRARFLGLDPNPAALRTAGAKARSLGLEDRVVLRRGSGQSMRFDSRFDVAYLGEVLCAVAAPSRILRNCRRALRPGGLLIVVEGLLDRNPRSSDRSAQLLAAMDLEFALQGARFLSKPELRDLLRTSGFVGVRTFDAGGGLSFVVARRT